MTRGVFINTKHMRTEYTRIMFCGNNSLCRLASLVWKEFNTKIPLSITRITAADEGNNFSKTLKTSQILLFRTPLLSGNYDVWGGTLDTNRLKTKDNLHHIHFLPHRDPWENVLSSRGKETFSIPRVRNRTENNALWWHCWDRSGVRQLLQCRSFCAMTFISYLIFNTKCCDCTEC
jgi:hypothetical protein